MEITPMATTASTATIEATSNTDLTNFFMCGSTVEEGSRTLELDG